MTSTTPKPGRPGGGVTSERDGRRVTITRKFQEHCPLDWPGWTKITIWIIFVIPLTVLTVSELISNYGQYKYNNFAPQMEFVKWNESATEIPPLTICFPYYSGSLDHVFKTLENDNDKRWTSPVGGELSSSLCPECEGMKNNSWDVRKPVAWPLAATSVFKLNQYSMTKALIAKLLHDGGDFRALVLNKTNFNWNQPIVDAAWLFLSCLFQQDREYIMGKTENSWELDDCDRYNFPDLGYIPDATIDQLFKLVLDALRVYASFSYSAPDIWNNDSISDSGLVPFGAKFCFPFPKSEVARFQYMNYTNYTNYERAIDPPWMRPMAEAQDWKVTRRLEVFRGNSSYTYYLSEDYILPLATLNTDKSGHYHLTMAYTVENHIDARRSDQKCSDEDPNICLGNRRFDRVTSQCKCVPFSLRHLRSRSPNLPYCNTTLYQACDKGMLQSEQADRAHCNDNKCDYFFYEWDHSDRFIAAEGYLSFDLMVHYYRAALVKSTFAPKLTFQQFLAQAGGSLNLYLGVSSLTILAALFFIIDLITHWRQRRASLMRWNVVIGGTWPIILGSLLTAPPAPATTSATSDDGGRTSIQINGNTCGMEGCKIEEMDMDELESHMRTCLLQLDRLKQLDSQRAQPVQDDTVVVIEVV